MSAVDAQALLAGHRIMPVYTPASVEEALAVGDPIAGDDFAQFLELAGAIRHRSAP